MNSATMAHPKLGVRHGQVPEPGHQSKTFRSGARNELHSKYG
jgi:hypothetical protein